ncbi:MAG: hypothetical protein ABSH20_04710 [Tepidisphaeraceae bacterium]
MRGTTLVAAAALGFVVGSAVWGAEKLDFKREQPTVETKVFDPARLPNPRPPLTPPEAACCVSDYQCDVEMEYSVAQEGPIAIAGKAQARITAVHAKVTAAIVIWLPRGANAELKAHEEGHRVIVERVYGKSDEPIRKVLNGFIGRTYDLRGGDADAAAEKAVREADAEASKACIKVIGDEAGRVSSIYDEITNHSMKKDPPAAKAVEQAFEQYHKETDKATK